jgi:thioesterase domain-containing protein
MRLDEGHPVYGIEPKRRADGGFAHTRIDEMAADYAARIQRLRPHGPYLLAGLCAGGVIAYEVARRLQDKGETVAFVGIMDAADVQAAKRRLYATRSRLERVRELLSNAGGLGVVPALLRKIGNYVAWQVQSRLERRHRLQIVDDMRRAETGVPDLSFLQLYELAHEAHRPEGLFAGGDVALFRATDGNGAPEDIPFADLYSDGLLGWGKRVADDVELVIVPGGHTSLLQEPHVERLALLLQQRLDDSLARWVPGEGIGSGGTRPASPAARPALVPVEMLR